MDEKLKIFWNLDVLVKMCRSKSDGPSLRVEEEEILEKINSLELEIEEMKNALDEDTYDTSAEMADRNIEIITKKQLQQLKNELKEKNKELNKLKDKENVLYNETSLLRENKASNEKYITSMQERLSENTDRDVLDRYNALITETLTKINELTEELKEENNSYEEVQNQILTLSGEIEELENKIDKKKKLLAETQASLENKDNYIDKTKREKNNKKIVDITEKIDSLEKRLEEIRKDPKYIETKIKDIINSKEDTQNARDYLSELVRIVINQPYINVPTDNALEEELLRATQARDSFANEIDQKSYNILEAKTPEKIRTDFLTKRIDSWQKELNRLHDQINKVDRDVQFNYEENDHIIEEMIKGLKNDLREFQRAYDDTPDTNIGVKAGLEVALEEKKEDIVEAEKIANLFKTNEAEDIANATRTLKYQCEQLTTNINQAEEEIKKIRNRLMGRKSGLIDIASRNKDKDVLKDLAQTVIDIKHRRQFPEPPIEIIRRLEEDLDIKVLEAEDLETIERTSVIESKNYDEFIEKKYEVTELPDEPAIYDEIGINPEDRALDNVEIMNPEELLAPPTEEEELQRLADKALANEPVINPEEELPEEETKEEPKEEEAESPEEEPVEETPEEDEEETEEGESDEGEAPIEETPEEEPVEEEEKAEEEQPVEEVQPKEEPEVEETPVEEEEPIEEEVVEEVPEEVPEEEIVEEVVEEPTEEVVEEVSEEEEPDTEVVEEAPAEEVAEEEPTIDEPVVEEPVEAPIEETPAVEEPSIEEEPTTEIVEEAPAEEVVEEAVETPVEETPIEENATEETPAIEEPTIEEPKEPEVQENPFGDAINPLANEEPKEEEKPEEDIVELSSNVGDDLSINSMFSNSVELSKQKNNEEVRNNLSDELDNFLNNLEDKK